MMRGCQLFAAAAAKAKIPPPTAPTIVVQQCRIYCNPTGRKCRVSRIRRRSFVGERRRESERAGARKEDTEI